MISLQCMCCGFEQSFADGEDAFRAGWDAPPHFTGVIACNLCPASLIVLGQKARHVSVHERWQREGRPVEFDQETCLAPDDRVPQETLDEFKRALGVDDVR